MLEHRCRFGEAAIGTLAPLGRRAFGPTAVGPWEHGVLKDAVVEGIVTAEAWAVRIALEDGTHVQASVARVPEDVAPGLSAFIAFLSGRADPVAVIAEDRSGAVIGSRDLLPRPPDGSERT
jgi:hypothetical protein